MKKYYLFLFSIFFTLPVFSNTKLKTHQIQTVPGEFIIRLNKGADLKKLGIKLSRDVNLKEGVHVIEQSDNRAFLKSLALNKRLSKKGVEKAFQSALEATKAFAYVEPNFLYSINDMEPISSLVPNDPSFSQLWGMSKIMAPEAWATTTGSRNVIVAVIDTGIDYTHDDLKDNLWSKTVNGRTVYGYNAITDSLDPMDGHSHGTHVAGTIGGVGNNGVGVVGVSWEVSLMGVKFLSDSGSGSTEDAIKAVDWATENGAHIMNNSWGGGGFSEALKESIERARDAGALFVAAAGNSTSNNDSRPHYPSSYDVENVFAVAATTQEDALASFSSFGRTSVDIMAPGYQVLSSVPGDTYQSYNGTSMATPHVAGAAALLLSLKPQYGYQEIMDEMIASSDKLLGLKRKIANGGARLNAYNLVNEIYPPGPVEVPDSAWSALVSRNIESAHPYSNNEFQRWTIEHPGANYLRIHFAEFNLESGYDYVRIYDGNGNLMDEFSGNIPNDFWSFQVDGDTAVIEFSSDSSITRDGFRIDGYAWSDFE